MKRSWLIVIGILLFSSFAFADSLVGRGESYVSTVSANFSSQADDLISDNSVLGLSILILAIIFGLIYWIIRRNRNKSVVKKRK